MKKGISLVVIVITIVIMIILGGVVVMGLTDNNPITNAQKAVFQDTLAKYKEDFQMYKNANIGKVIEDCKGKDVKKYVENLQENDIGDFAIENQNLIYVGGKKNEREWAKSNKIFTSRNKAPVLIGEKKTDIMKLQMSHLTNYGINTNSTYVIEGNFLDNEDIPQLVKYTDQLKKEWSIDSVEYATVNYQGKYLYAFDKNKIYKIKDETGKIEKEADLGLEFENFYQNRILIDDQIRVYVLDNKKNQLHITTLNKETFEKIGTKKLDFGLEDTTVQLAEQSKKAVYLKANIFDGSSKGTKDKLHIFKISSDKLEWEINIDSTSAVNSIIEHKDDIMISAFNIKELGRKLYRIDSRNGKVKKVVNISNNIGEIYSCDDQNNMIVNHSKNGTIHIGKFNSNFEEIWSVDLLVNENIINSTIISVPENDNIMIISSLDEKDSKIRRYLFE